MSRLVIDCDGKLVTDCAGKLVVGCPPKYICSELTLNPDLKLKFTWSGTLNRCTDCWDVDDLGLYFWQCLSAPTSLPNAAGVKQCFDPWNPWIQVDLPTFLVMQQCSVGCGVGSCSDITGRYARFHWYCAGGVFYFIVNAVTTGGTEMPLFYATAVAADFKDGDTLNNSLACLVETPDLDCGGAQLLPFVTGGSYKVEIDNS
jgi:hypothetical protein